MKNTRSCMSRVLEWGAERTGSFAGGGKRAGIDDWPGTPPSLD